MGLFKYQELGISSWLSGQQKDWHHLVTAYEGKKKKKLLEKFGDTSASQAKWSVNFIQEWPGSERCCCEFIVPGIDLLGFKR